MEQDLEQFAAYHSRARSRRKDPFNLQIDIGPHDLFQPRYLKAVILSEDDIAFLRLCDDLKLHVATLYIEALQLKTAANLASSVSIQ